jgi:hypothetical protein
VTGRTAEALLVPHPEHPDHPAGDEAAGEGGSVEHERAERITVVGQRFFDARSRRTGTWRMASTSAVSLDPDPDD